MVGLVIGIDLCDNYTQISCAGEDKTWTIPTVICKNKYTDEWYIGKEAQEHLEQGDLIEQLLSKFQKNDLIKIDGKEYLGKQLLERFLQLVFAFVKKEMEQDIIERIVFTMSNSNGKLVKLFQQCGMSVGVPRKQVHTISHVESVVYYILSQKREVWGNTVGVFDLSKEHLVYYEMSVQRGKKMTAVVADYDVVTDNDVVTDHDVVTDQFLCDCVDQYMGQKAFSSVFLTGEGFKEYDWADEFVKKVARRQRVYGESAIFSKGAFYRGFDYGRETTAYPYMLLFEGRLKSTVEMTVLVKGQEHVLEVATMGSSWYHAKKSLEVLLDNQSSIDFTVTPFGVNKKHQVQILLENLPKRPNKTTKVRVKVVFLDDKTMEVTVHDKGFGELFPTTGYRVKQEVTI